MDVWFGAEVLVIAKRPLPGRVKTRLVPPLTPAQAADLAAAALQDTLDAVDALGCARRTLLFDGDPAGWVRPGWRHVAQVAGGLDRRIVAGFEAADPGPSVLVGMDTPQLRPDQLTDWDTSRYDACLGPATDGGYWAIGFADPQRDAAATVLGVPMSREDTGAVQLRRLRDHGLRVQLLDELADVDTVDVAAAVAAAAPGTCFARALELVRRAA